MGKWEMVRLGDIAIINMGQSPESSTYNQTGRGVPFYQGNADFGERYPVKRFWCSAPKKLSTKGDVLISVRAPIGAMNFSIETCCIGRGLASITSKVQRLEQNYLWYILKSNYDFLNRQGTGSTFKAINKNVLSELLIPLPPLDEQERIAKNLDLASEIVKGYKEQLAELDNLVQSVFYEMFGDPVENLHHYNSIRFKECIEYMGDIGSNGANAVISKNLKMKDSPDYAIMVRFLNFTANDFTNNIKYIDETTYNFFTKSKLYGGELIFCKIGSAGMNYLMPNLHKPVSLGLNQILTRVKNNIEMKYLYHYLNTNYGKHLVNGCINGAVTKSITKTALKEIPIILPPLLLQQKFASIVTEIEAQKTQVQQALTAAENLFNSLMQEYFE